MYKKQTAEVAIIEINTDGKKVIFNFNRKGKRIKNVREGGININILLDNRVISAKSFLSMYIQIIAKSEVRGRDIRKPASKVERLDTSAINIIKKEVNMTLSTMYIIKKCFYLLVKNMPSHVAIKQIVIVEVM